MRLGLLPEGAVVPSSLRSIRGALPNKPLQPTSGAAACGRSVEL